jgi:D-alanine--poly(phosphoribitol) ligase subunit 1
MDSVLQLLENTAARVPERKAFSDEVHTFTWAEVQDAAARLGTAIWAAGAEKRPVLLYFDKCALCPVAMLGTLAAGAFYTVLDIEQPMDRMQRIAEQLHPAAVVTDAAHAEAAASLAPACIVWEQAMEQAPDTAALAGVRARAVDTDLAYVLFTSGSTGTPKGVALTHRNVLAYSKWFVDTFHITEENIFGGQTPFYFSMSVSDVYGCLRAGAQLVTIPRRMFGFPVPLLDFMTAHNVNTIYWVPSALGFVANWKALAYTQKPPLHTILFAGEVMPCSKLNYWRANYPDALFANLYGPTETTDICAYYIVDRPFADDEPLPIGRPCHNCGLLILNEKNCAAAPDEEGELCARGSFLAAGYYDMPEKTAERFTQNPLQPHLPDIIYRTGDLVKYNARGELIFCGRKDNQIKHRGYRIELGEIDTAAMGVPGMEECACLYDAAQDKLVLFYAARKDLVQALTEALQKKLPPYMLPARYERLRAMPHNANGKIDRKELKLQYLVK